MNSMDYIVGGFPRHDKDGVMDKHEPGKDSKFVSKASSTLYRHQAYKNTKTRLLSYNGASKGLMKMARALSEAGYFYEGYNTKTCCYACGMKHENWSEEDDPINEHLKENPNCIHALQTKPKLNYVSSIDSAYQSNPQIAKTAKYPEYTESLLRAASFQGANGPGPLKMRIPDIVKSGFFYAGIDNKVTCFHCGISTSLDWSENPTDKHLSLSPNCGYLRFEIQKLNDETERVRQQLLCKVCLSKQVNTTFRPCGHLATCESCARQLDICPICRTPVIEKVKTFL